MHKQEITNFWKFEQSLLVGIRYEKCASITVASKPVLMSIQIAVCRLYTERIFLDKQRLENESSVLETKITGGDFRLAPIWSRNGTDC